MLETSDDKNQIWPLNLSPAWGRAVRIAAWYALLGVVWIVGSGWLLHHLVQEPVWASLIEEIKGWLFVLFTAGLLCWYLGRYFAQISSAVALLKASEERLRLMGDNLPDSYVYQYYRDAAGNPIFSYISAGIERVHGVKPADVMGDADCLRLLVLPESRAKLVEAERASAKTMSDSQVEIWTRQADGSRRLIHLRSRPRRAPTGTIVWDGIAIDVTQRRQAENALRERERQLHLFVEHSPAAIAMLDADMRYLIVSRRWLSGYRLEDKDITGKSHYEVFPEIPQRWREIHQRCLRGAVEECDADPFLRADGTVDWVRWEIRPWHTNEGGIGGLIIFSELITDRKVAEDALRQSEENFRAMFELASVGMAQADPRTGQWVRVNQKMCEITGYSEQEMLRMRVVDITHPEDRDRDWEFFQKIVSGELPAYHIEKRYRRRDGTEAWVNVNATVLRDAQGKPVRAMATIEDVTERKLAEAERVRLVTALEQSAESILITDSQGTILYVNPAFETITGYSRHEALGRNPRFLKSGIQDEAFYRLLWDTLGRGEVWHGRLVNKRKNGTLFEEEATISPVRDANGKVVNFVAIKLDVTRQVELEAQFRQAQKMEAIGQLAGGVAHDFNNILAAIMMQADLTAMTEGLPEEVAQGLREIRASADRAASLTRQLLLFSRRQVMRLRDLDLNEVVTSIAKMLQRMIGEDIRMQLNLHPAPLTTRADAGMLDQVLMNLAVNARDAMHGGGGRLVIETSEKEVDAEFANLYPEAIPGRYVWLSITDTGKGISPEILPRIFEPFFTTKEAGKGTGLGLATVFGIVKQHRGWINAYSQLGQGTNFQVFLPAVSAPAARVSPHTTRPKPRRGTETVLLVEDNAAVRALTRAALERYGYTIIEAGTGAEAMGLWPNYRAQIALLLTDLVMPGGTTGQQLAQHLKAEKPELRVVFTSGYSAEIAGRDLELRPGENFLQKPFQSDELLESVRRSLDSPEP